MGQQYSHLSSEERILIEKLHCERHLSIRRTAEEIGRDKSTVSRELRRGLWFASNVCFVKLGSAFCAVFFRSVGSGFSAGCAVSAAACLRCVGYLVMRACSLR